MRGVLVVLACGVAGQVRAQDPPRLWVMGPKVAFGQPVTATVSSDHVGAAVLIAIGLDPLPLDAPIPTGKGPWYIGQLTSLVAPGAIGASGRLDLPFALPDYHPLLDNVHVALQAFVAGKLSNPATLPLVQPYFLAQDVVVVPPPLPSQGAEFGDRVAVGDLNDDGFGDLAVGAWFETVNGQIAAGRVYIMWGPDFVNFTQLTSPTPSFARTYGASVMVADLDLDGVDDLVIGETTGEPPDGKRGKFHVFHGGPSFSSTPDLTVLSAGSGAPYLTFGRFATLGDLNGDGHPEIVVGITNASHGTLAFAGRVDVYVGPSFGERLELFSPEPGANDYFGSALAVADIDGDGIGDLIEGSGRTDVGGVVNLGRCHVFYGPALATSTTIECPLPDGFNTRFGQEVSSTDFDDDGIADLITSDQRDHAFVFPGPDLRFVAMASKPSALGDGTPPDLSFGYTLAAADLTLDGAPDLCVGEELGGPSKNCGLLGLGGYVYIAHGPHFATFDRMQDFVVQCESSFGNVLCIPRPQWRTTTGRLVVGNNYFKNAGLFNVGRVVVFR